MAWCLPVLALAASAAGAGLQMAGAQKAKDEANRRVSQELARQKGFQEKSTALYQMDQSRAGAGDAQTGIKSGAQERQGQYEQAQQIPLSYSQPGTQIGKAVVNARDAASMNLSNRSRAALAGYDKWLMERMIQQQQTGNLLGITASQARSSGNVLPMELNSAQHAGDSLAGAGSLLGMAGSFGSNYAASTGSLCRPRASSAGMMGGRTAGGLGLIN